MLLLVTAACLLVAGCWLEPVNPPRAEIEEDISRVWAGDYEGYTVFHDGYHHDEIVHEVLLRIHSHNHNRVSFECTLRPRNALYAPQVHVEGEVQDTFRCRIVNYFPDVVQLVDLWRTPRKIYGGMLTMDYNNNLIWKMQRLEVRPKQDR